MPWQTNSSARKRKAAAFARPPHYLNDPAHLGEAAPAPKTPAAPRANQAKPPANTAQSALDQAKRLIDAEQPEAAAVMLRRFIESGPAPDLLDDTYLLMAAAMYGMKEHAETVRYVNQLLGEFPTSDLVDRAKLLLAKSHARAGNLDLALPLLSEVRSLSADPAIKRDALRLTGVFQAQKKDFLRAIQAWLDELPLDAGDQAHETEGQIRELVNDKLTTYDESIEMISNEKPDLLMIDIMIEGNKDGIDLAETVNQEFNLPFIFLTANKDF